MYGCRQLSVVTMMITTICMYVCMFADTGIIPRSLIRDTVTGPSQPDLTGL